MSLSIQCSQCGAALQPSGLAPRVRCEYCQTDNLLDAATLSQLAGSGIQAPPELQSRFRAALEPHMNDPQALLDALAHRLAQALPGQVQVERHGGLFTKAHATKVSAEAGDHRYELDLVHGHLEAKRVHAVRGIALKSTPLSAPELMSALAAELHDLDQRVHDHAVARFLAD